jgi:hypothetical protein
MDITILRARIIAITFMAGLAWGEGRVPDVQAGSGAEKEVAESQVTKLDCFAGSFGLPCAWISRRNHDSRVVVTAESGI